MTIKANGRSVLIIAAGIWMCVAGPAHTAEDVEGTSEQAAKIESTQAVGQPVALNRFVKHATHLRKRHAWGRRNASRVGWKSSRHKHLAAADISKDTGDVSSILPPGIANANAKLPSSDATDGDANAMSTRSNATPGTASDASASEVQNREASEQVDDRVTAADELNDVDRALLENSSTAAPLMTIASASTPAVTAPSAQITTGTDDTAWSQSSTIGKIFIAFGGLLALGSAARMLMTS